MRLPLFFGIVAGYAVLAQGQKIVPEPALARENAPQVFNAVHSAMRQWGSSGNLRASLHQTHLNNISLTVYHNGMSFFLVTVPRGNLFYHGCATPERRSGLEWLAFEPEHAAYFGSSRDGLVATVDSQPTLRNAPQSILLDPRPPPHREPRRGYLHTYSAARDLRLLFTDGQSAAKGLPGALDTQDLVLIMDTILPGGFVEYERAEALCKLALAHNLDGVIRIEAGFEIIYCAFEDGGGLDLASVVGSPFSNETTGETRQASFESFRAVAQRYHGFEADRALVDYSSMVSAFWYPINRTNPDVSRPDMPRLVNATGEERRTLLDRVLEVTAARPTRSQFVHWQAVADRVVNFFERRLAALAAPEATPITMRRLLDSILNQFIDFAQPASRRKDTVTMCTYHHLQRPLGSKSTWTPEDHLIFESFATVTNRICASLHALRGGLDDLENMSPDFAAEKDSVSSLMSWLGWTRWRGCGGLPCQEHNKVCLVRSYATGVRVTNR